MEGVFSSGDDPEIPIRLAAEGADRLGDLIHDLT
jgi:hypothetical protein